MNADTKINIFAASAILLFGSVLGGLLTYQHLNDRISELENQPQPQLEDNQDLRFLFQEVEESIVSIEPLDEEGGHGSGFVYDNDGHIITNEHVVRNQENVRIVFTDGTSEDAEIVGTDPDTDLAVLRVENHVEPLDLADSNNLNVGERTVAIGNPFGLETSMTDGIISQTERRIQVREGFSIPNVIQTDAAINPGNSGGPLMNYDGEVIGVNTAIESDTGTFTGIGFAISSNTVEEVVPSLIEEGDYEHPWLGVEGIDVDGEIAEHKNLENATGFLIIDTVEGSPGDIAGIQSGEETVELTTGEAEIGGADIIIGIDDQPVDDINDIIDYLLTEKDVGDTTTLEVLRDGEKTELELDLQPRP